MNNYYFWLGKDAEALEELGSDDFQRRIKDERQRQFDFFNPGDDGDSASGD